MTPAPAVAGKNSNPAAVGLPDQTLELFHMEQILASIPFCSSGKISQILPLP